LTQVQVTLPLTQAEPGVEQASPSAQPVFGLPPVPVEVLPPIRAVHESQRSESLQVQP